MDFETFEKIYKSRSIIYKMLRLRGYDTTKYDSTTKEELNILFQNHSKKMNYEIDSLDMVLEGENNSVLVKYILNDKLKRNLEKTVENIYTDILKDHDTCILITKENHIKNKDGNKNSSPLEEYINRSFMNKGRFIQILCLNNYCFDISEHELVPKYRILTPEEKQEVLDKFHITEEQNPNVFVSDPLATFYGVKVGDLVEVTKTSETNGYTKYYRLCKFS